MKMTIFGRFRGACFLHHQGGLMMEAASTCEKSVNFNQTTWRNNPGDSHLHGNESSGSIKGGVFLDQKKVCQFLKSDSAPRNLLNSYYYSHSQISYAANAAINFLSQTFQRSLV
jgi:hypothetical protein